MNDSLPAIQGQLYEQAREARQVRTARAVERRELSKRNLAYFAEVFNWPEGVLEACLELEDANTDYGVSWWGEDTRTGKPAGFYARYAAGDRSEPLRAATREGIQALIDEDRPKWESILGPYKPIV